MAPVNDSSAPASGTVSSPVAAAIPVKRGCGVRTQGGAYWEYGLPRGVDPGAFIIDVPQPLPPGFRLAARGVQVVKYGSAYHVVDWVGREHYHNLADFLQEVFLFGVSRRIPGSTDFEKLSPASRILLVHERAIVRNSRAYEPYTCPLRRHDPVVAGCAGVWWRDIEGGAPIPAPGDPDRVRRAMPSFSYVARARPAGVAPAYESGIFASFPASRFAIVRSPNGAHEAVAARVRKAAGIPVAEVDA